MKKENLEINLIATGDIMLGGSLGESLKQNGFVYLFSDFKKCFQGADILFGNLEGPLSNRGEPQTNKILLHQERKAIDGLKYIGYNVLSLGNNHIMDFGENGLTETLEIVQEYGIQRIGAGANVADARKPAEFCMKGTKITILGYASSTTDKTNPLIYAEEAKGGLVPLDLKIVKEDIKEARSSGADIVIISLHWGEDRYHLPSPEQVEKARSIVDIGANIILGHHSHILHGIERYKKGIIIYSLGNFLFGEFLFPNGRVERWPLRNRLTAYVKCKIKKDGMIDYNVVPLWIGKNLIPRILEGREERKVFSNIQRYSGALESANYEKFWRKEVFKEEINIVLEKIRLKLSRYEI